MRTLPLFSIPVLLLPLSGCADRARAPDPPLSVLEARLGRVQEAERAPVRGTLPPGARGLLRELSEAGAELDRIFWKQSYPPAAALLEEFSASPRPWDQVAARLVRFHAGPFDRLQEMEPFLDMGPRPPGGGLWPPFVTREGIAGLVAGYPDRAEDLLDPRTVVFWEDEELLALPYSYMYRERLRAAAARVRAAATLAGDGAPASYLLPCADALERGEGCPAPGNAPGAGGLVAILGPLGASEDRLLRRKSSYVAMVGWVDAGATAELEVFVKGEEDLLRYLLRAREDDETGGTAPGPSSGSGITDPGPGDTRGAARSGSLWVADETYRGGATAHGLQPLAWTSANPQGWSSVLWRDRIELRRAQILEPLAERVLEPGQLSRLTARGSFHLVVFRELARGLVPLHGPPEEFGDPALAGQVQAMTLGLLAAEWFVRRGALPDRMVPEHQIAHLMDLLASVRVAPDSLTARASRILLNWHFEHGGILYDPDSRLFSVNPEALLDSATELSVALLAPVESGEETEAGRSRVPISGISGYDNPGPEVRGLIGSTEDLPLEVFVADEPAPEN